MTGFEPEDLEQSACAKLILEAGFSISKMFFRVVVARVLKADVLL